MAIYYVDPNALGANNGTSWTDAWTSIQSAFDNAVANDTTYCRNTETLTVTLDIDTNQGSKTTGLIRFVGCNSSGVNDSTRFIIDANNVATYCIEASYMDYYYFENFEFKNAIDSGVRLYNSEYHVFNNCSFNNNGDNGFYVYLGNACAITLIKCIAHSNTSHGFYFYSGTSGQLLFCRARNNGGNGFYIRLYQRMFGCISDNNTGYGIQIKNVCAAIINCVIDNNGSGGILAEANGASFFTTLIGNRITNHDSVDVIGFDGSSYVQFQGWNYFENNTGDNIQNDAYIETLLDNGITTTIEDQSNVNQGYTSTTDPEDYNLRSDASLSSIAIEIPES